MPRVLVTGGLGLVGKAVARNMAVRGFDVRVSTRRPPPAFDSQFEYVTTTDLSADGDWTVALESVDVVVHCAARVHVMNDSDANPLAAFRAANTAGTLNLARQSAAAGIKRFVFISSVKVNGEATSATRAFNEADSANPQDDYGHSKHEAELGLREVATATGMEVVIIRPPLVYGPGVKANFGALIRAVQRGMPLPLGAIDNRRSLVALANLVDFIHLCAVHPQAANQTFLVSDGDDLSTAQLVRGLGRVSGRRTWLISVPLWLLQLGGTLAGKRGALQRVCGNLQVDISKARERLGWIPPITVEEGLRRAIEGTDDNEKII